MLRAVNTHEEARAALQLALATIERLTISHKGGFSSTAGTQDIVRTVIAKMGDA